MQKKATIERNIPQVQTPEILKRINAVRNRLSGTDRGDHLDTIDEWEKKAKASLIALSLMKHEGPQILISKARAEITAINQMLIHDRPTGGDLAKYALERQYLFDRKDLWLWFLNFFSDSIKELEEIDKDLALQETPDLEDAPQF